MNDNGVNAGGGWNPFNFAFLANIWNRYIKTDNMRLKDKSGEDHVYIDMLKEFAAKTNNSEYYRVLAKVYLTGAPEIGLQQNYTKSIYYFEEAAKRGDVVSMFSIGIVNINDNQELARDYLSQ